jgi:hypothetical protein
MVQNGENRGYAKERGVPMSATLKAILWQVNGDVMQYYQGFSRRG